MRIPLFVITVLLVSLVTGFGEADARAAQTEGAPKADLRPEFEKLGLGPRQEGDRPTCSVFTVVGALEFAVAKRQGHCPRLSVEFLNWSANRACGDKDDGGF